jgi:hypothetical protein
VEVSSVKVGLIYQSSDKFLRIVSVVMNPRKPKLDWIKKVLADPVGETRLRVVCGPEPAQSDCRSTDDQLGQSGGDARLVCLSWQL